MRITSSGSTSFAASAFSVAPFVSGSGVGDGGGSEDVDSPVSVVEVGCVVGEVVARRGRFGVGVRPCVEFVCEG